MLLVPQSAAATWRVVCAIVCPCFPLGCVFPWFFVLLCYYFFFLFFTFFSPSSFFSSVRHIARGGGTGGEQFYFYCFYFFYIFHFVFFAFLLFALFPFVSLYHRMCISCLSYLLKLYDDMTLHCPLLLWFMYNCYVTTYYLWGVALWPKNLSLLRLKNRHGHWLCWISTGRKNGWMWRTHTHLWLRCLSDARPELRIFFDYSAKTLKLKTKTL